jgi:hypothetical protein
MVISHIDASHYSIIFVGQTQQTFHKVVPMADKREITAKELEQIEELAGLGLSLNRIAGFLGMHRNYFRELAKKDDAIQCAIGKGQAKAEVEIQKTAFEMAKSGKHPNMTLGWLKMRVYIEELELKRSENLFSDLMYMVR